MEFTSFDERELVIDVLKQIKTAISPLQEWNAEVTSEDDYYQSSGGMQKLAASCMLIEAIGEGVTQIDKSPMEDYCLNAQRFLGEIP